MENDKEDKAKCPNCGNGIHGVDPLCEDCWKEYLGTHLGGRGVEDIIHKEQENDK